jgi:flagellar protein FlgJ
MQISQSLLTGQILSSHPGTTAGSSQTSSRLERQFELIYTQMLNAALDLGSQADAPSSETDSDAMTMLLAHVSEGFAPVGLPSWPAPSSGLLSNTASNPPIQHAVQAYQAAMPEQPNGQGKRAFIAAMLPQAQAAAQQLGVAPELIVAHAALESGWGGKTIRRPDGSDSHNLFGIKAGAGWKGEVVEATTTEYVDGSPHKTTAHFRAYPSAAAAFADYASLLSSNPRYQRALGSGEDIAQFTRGLQLGGYASDPRYGEKLVQMAGAVHGVRG